MNKFWLKKFGDYLAIILLAIFLSIYIVELGIFDLCFFLLLGFGLAIFDLLKSEWVIANSEDVL